MPEAAMNKYRRLMAGQDDVRASGQILAMKAKTKTMLMEKAADYLFGGRIFPPNSRHYRAALGGSEYVSHWAC